MDEADTATDYQTRLNAAAESARIRYEGDSAHECEDCGEAIPAARREAIPGCKRCIGCEDIKERRA